MYLLFDYNNATIVQQFLLDKYKHTKGERRGRNKTVFREGRRKGGSLLSLINQLLVFAILRLNTHFEEADVIARFVSCHLAKVQLISECVPCHQLVRAYFLSLIAAITTRNHRAYFAVCTLHLEIGRTRNRRRRRRRRRFECRVPRALFHWPTFVFMNALRPPLIGRRSLRSLGRHGRDGGGH